MTPPALAALLDAVPDPDDHDACLRHREALEAAGGVGRWTVGGEIVTYDEWKKARLEECNNGTTD